MSQKGESENGIWNYKPLAKKQKQRESSPGSSTVLKRRCLSRKSSQKSTSAKSSHGKVDPAKHEDCSAGDDVPGDRGSGGGSSSRKKKHHLPSTSSLIEDTDQSHSGSSSQDFCPMCQMPFSILVVQTQRWHIAECLETSRDSYEGIWNHKSPFF